MNNLFSDDENPEGGSNPQLTINEHYAKAFEYRKEREELERLKAKYGSDYDPDASDSEFSTDSESAESEDEDGEELTPVVDAAILRTLARIRKKDPAIYDSGKNIYGEEQERLHSTIPLTNAKQTKSNKKEKPLTVRQVNLDAMLNPSRTPPPEVEQHLLTHVEEQEILRKETIAAFHGAVDNQAEDDFLIPREKTQDERDREEEEYRAFLEREVGDLRDVVSVDGVGNDEESVKEDVVENDDEKGTQVGKKKKRTKKTKDERDANNELSNGKQKRTKAEKDQEFLMSYILNRGWIDRSTGHIPTYGEITSPGESRQKKKGKAKSKPRDDSEMDGEDLGNSNDDEMDTGLLSDTSFESLASHFEASYNHRFEEPGAATIASFPRILPSAVRRQDTTRKEARERRKERKEEELRKRQEEVKRMKALKMREIKRKLEWVGREAGLKKKNSHDNNDDGEFVDEALKELDLEGEWDPDKHDRQMAGLFDQDAEVGEDDDAWAGEFGDDGELDSDGKPKWDDDIDIGDIALPDDDAAVFHGDSRKSKREKKLKKKKKKKADEDEDGAVDVDAMDAELQQNDEEWDGTEEMRKRKLNEYMDEVYGLDFNDIVGGVSTRFRYVPVQPQTYALTPVEILLATDQELNQYVSVKKYAPYRQDKGDRYRWNKKDQEKLHELKSTIKNRTGNAFGMRSMAGGQASSDGGEKVKRKGKKERMKAKVTLGQPKEISEVPVNDQTISVVDPETTSFKKRKRDDRGVVQPGESEPRGEKKRKHQENDAAAQA